MGKIEHEGHAKAVAPARCAIITVSDNRTEATDESGRDAISLLKKAKHHIVFYSITKNNPKVLANTIKKLIGKVDLIITIGGTGISKKDISIDVTEKFIEKKLDGFGELFRAISFKEIGSSTIISRALLGISGKTILLSLPGSSNAVRIALNKILLPELKHILWELNRY